MVRSSSFDKWAGGKGRIPVRNQLGSTRFGSGLFENSSVRFRSEKTFPGSTWFGLRFSEASWLGPVRFGSVPRPVPAGSGINRFGSAASVRFLIPSWHPPKASGEKTP